MEVGLAGAGAGAGAGACTTSPIVIISTWMNQPDMLLLHRRLWCAAFPGEDIRYVAYIDAKPHPDHSNYFKKDMHLELMHTCIENKIEYVMVPQKFHDDRRILFPNTPMTSSQASSQRDSLVCQMAWIKEVLRRPQQTRIFFVQCDILPYKKKTWAELLGGASFYYRKQIREDAEKSVTYAWEGLCAFDLRKWTGEQRELVSFEMGIQKGLYTDTGGATWRILEALAPEEKRELPEKSSMRWRWDETDLPPFPRWLGVFLRMDPRNEDRTCFSELLDDWCFHLRAGSNWDKPDIQKQVRRHMILKMCIEKSEDEGDSLFIES